MQQLTNEEITRVFAMYMPCKFMYEEEINNLVAVGSGWIYSDEADESGEGVFGTEDCKLLLTPLSAITDEHAAELSEVFFPDGNVYDYLHGAPTGRAIVASIKNNRQTNTFYPHARIFDGFQYLIHQNYAVPLFFDFNHWANGKTAIQLDIAIERNK